MKLSERESKILKAVIDDYIETAEPVASRTLVERYKLPLSSATVRNTMADLERKGYLESPHTSSGRIPSDQGYREYIEHLITVDKLEPEEADEIRTELSEGMPEITDMLRRASGVLSEGTGYTSVALTPRMQSSRLQQIKLLSIEPGRVLIVVILSAGIVRDKIVRVSDLLNAQQLRQIGRAIEQGLAGTRLEDITFITVQTVVSEQLSIPDSLLNQVAFEAYTAIKQADNFETYIDGMPNIFDHPEFQNVNRARGIVNALSQDGLIIGLMDQDSQIGEQMTNDMGPSVVQHPHFMIRIGQELQQEALRDCSFVTTTYSMPDRLLGSIGVVGPRRMDYSNVISHVGFIRQTMQQLMQADTKPISYIETSHSKQIEEDKHAEI